MTLKDFYNNYDFNDITIIKSITKEDKLYLYLSFEISIPFVANGCRPEFDYDVVHLFIFDNQNTRCKNIDNIQNIIDVCIIDCTSICNKILRSNSYRDLREFNFGRNDSNMRFRVRSDNFFNIAVFCIFIGNRTGIYSNSAGNSSRECCLCALLTFFNREK